MPAAGELAANNGAVKQIRKAASYLNKATVNDPEDPITITPKLHGYPPTPEIEPNTFEANTETPMRASNHMAEGWIWGMDSSIQDSS